VKKIIFILLGVFISFLAYSQAKEANIWVFGKKALVDFNTTPPTIEWSEIITQEGCASIANVNGELEFYTDGVTVFSKDDEVMENGTNLNGHFSSTQSGIIVPKPDDPNIYYIFTVPYQGDPLGLQYSIVDISLNGGLGKVIDKNIQLVTPVTEKVTAMKHYNNEDIWVITHGWKAPEVPGGDTIPSKKFFAYLVTDEGINEEPVVSNVGWAHGGLDLNTVGYLKGSPDGTKISLAVYLDEIYELFDFNNETGVVSNPITFEGFKRAYGLEYSPNSRILYISEEDSIHVTKMHIYQIDLFAGSPQEIKNSLNYIGYTTNNETYGQIGRGAMQVGPDGKIYIARYWMPWLGTINNPNLWGTASELVDDGLWLESNTARISYYGLPTFIQSYFSPPLFEYDHVCYGDITDFWITSDITGYVSVEWFFGDGHTSTDLAPSHQYSAPGDFIVTLVVHYLTADRTAESVIEILSSPDPAFTYDPYCFGAPTQFYDDSNPNGGTISEWFWDFGDGTSSVQNPTHIFTTSGQHSIELSVTTSNGCFNVGMGTVDQIPPPGTPGKPAGTTSMCENSPDSQYTTSGHPDAVSYHWEIAPAGAGNISGSSTTAIVNWNNSFTGTATIKVKSINVCNEMGNASTPLSVTITPLPNVFAGVDKTAPYLTTVILSDASVSGSAPFDYFWTPIDSLQPGQHTDLHPETIPITETTLYNLKATDDNGCINNGSVLVVRIGGPVSVYVTASNYAVCYGFSSTLHAIPTGGSGTYIYNWTSDPPGFTSNVSDPTVTPETTTTYFLEMEDADNPTNNTTGQITVEVKPLPYVITEDIVYCFHNDDVELDCEYGGGNGEPYTFSWEPWDKLVTNSLPQVTTVQLAHNQEYTVEITDGFGCKSSDTVLVVVSDDFLAVSAVADEYVLCEGEATMLTATATGGVPGTYTYFWEPPDAVVDPQNAVTMTNPLYSSRDIHVKVTDQTGSDANYVVEITVNPLPDIHLPPPHYEFWKPDTIITCIYDTLQLDAFQDDDEHTFTYNWSNGEKAPFIEVWTTGIGHDIQTYSVIVENNETLCKDSAILTIIFSFDWCTEGIDDRQNSDAYIYTYPNPTTGKVNLAMKGITGSSEIHIMSLAGQIVYTEKMNLTNQEGTLKEIDITGLPGGIYVIYVVNEKGFYTDKLVLQR